MKVSFGPDIPRGGLLMGSVLVTTDGFGIHRFYAAWISKNIVGTPLLAETVKTIEPEHGDALYFATRAIAQHKNSDACRVSPYRSVWICGKF